MQAPNTGPGFEAVFRHGPSGPSAKSRQTSPLIIPAQEPKANARNVLNHSMQVTARQTCPKGHVWLPLGAIPQDSIAYILTRPVGRSLTTTPTKRGYGRLDRHSPLGTATLASHACRRHHSSELWLNHAVSAPWKLVPTPRTADVRPVRGIPFPAIRICYLGERETRKRISPGERQIRGRDAGRPMPATVPRVHA